MKKLALIVGHNISGKRKGAKNYLGEYESEFNYRIAKKVKNKLKKFHCGVKIFTRDGKMLLDLSKEVTDFYPDMSLELHFNSFRKPAFGCEVLALEFDPESSALARLIAANISYGMDIKRRRDQGLYTIRKGGRGFKNLNYIRMHQKSNFPKVIVEPCFANIKTKESTFFFENEDEYVFCLVKSIKEQLKLESTKHVPDTKKIDFTKSPKNIIDRIILILKKLFRGLYE
jgi:N-acetylmuramoyl-L-alanine amidase